MQPTVKDRLIQFIKSQKIAVRAFESAAGLSNGYLRNLRSSPTVSVMEKIFNAYPDLNRDWLMTGEGPMLVDDSTPAPAEQAPTRPRIPVTAAAGYLSGIAEGISAADCELVPVIPGVPDYACTIVVHGDSMTPKFESGDELAITPVRDRRSILWGHAYVLDTRDGTILKRLYDHDPDTVRCVSYNPEYPDSYVDKSSIISIWRIVALLRRY